MPAAQESLPRERGKVRMGALAANHSRRPDHFRSP